jgi:hypothetical protein
MAWQRWSADVTTVPETEWCCAKAIEILWLFI